MVAVCPHYIMLQTSELSCLKLNDPYKFQWDLQVGDISATFCVVLRNISSCV